VRFRQVRLITKKVRMNEVMARKKEY
jgi:hypothetical protein